MIGDQLSKDGMTNERLLEFFKRAQEQLISIIARANADSPFRSYRSRQLKAINVVLMRLQGQIQDWTTGEIPKLVNAGATETQKLIDDFDESKFQLDFAGVPESAIKVLTEDAYLEFGTTIVGMKRDASRALLNKKKLADEIVHSVIQGSSVARTQNQLIDILKEQGITGFKTRNGFGRSLKVEPYTNMLVRSQSMTAYNLGARAQMLGVGRRFAVFPTIRPDIDGEDICNEWERKKYIDLLKDQLPPQSTHPNCRHRPLPVSMEELKAERPDLYRLAIGYWNDTAED